MTKKVLFVLFLVVGTSLMAKAQTTKSNAKATDNFDFGLSAQFSVGEYSGLFGAGLDFFFKKWYASLVMQALLKR